MREQTVPLHPVIQDMMAQAAGRGAPAWSALSPQEARAELRRGRVALGRGPENIRSEDLSIPTRDGSIDARLLWPDQAPDGVVVYLHGGGWVLGDLDDYDAVGRTLASQSNCLVLMPAYRLAPEHPFPAALHDAEDALRWAGRTLRVSDARTLPLVVVGDSAGANLATVAVRGVGSHEVLAQVLVYPVTDSGMSTGSYGAFGQGLPLTRSDMQWLYRHYAPEELWATPDISPLQARDLSGSPPAIVVTAEFDILRDEGEAYARRLAEAGVDVTAWRVPSLPHGFLRLHNLVDACGRALSSIAAAINQACTQES